MYYLKEMIQSFLLCLQERSLDFPTITNIRLDQAIAFVIDMSFLISVASSMFEGLSVGRPW